MFSIHETAENIEMFSYFTFENPFTRVFYRGGFLVGMPIKEMTALDTIGSARLATYSV